MFPKGAHNGENIEIESYEEEEETFAAAWKDVLAFGPGRCIKEGDTSLPLGKVAA